MLKQNAVKGSEAPTKLRCPNHSAERNLRFVRTSIAWSGSVVGGNTRIAVSKAATEFDSSTAPGVPRLCALARWKL
jgi:hypothetical protein